MVEFTLKEWNLIWLCVEDKCNNSDNYKLKKLSDKIQNHKWELKTNGNRKSIK